MKVKQKNCNMTFTEEDYNLLREKAKLNGLSPAMFSRMVIIKMINNIKVS